MDAEFGESSLNTTEPSGVMARSPRRKYPPHPPFGHLLPGGEKGTVPAPAERVDCRGEPERSPSPHRGEGRGEGVRAVASSEESPSSPAMSPVGPTVLAPGRRRTIGGVGFPRIAGTDARGDCVGRDLELSSCPVLFKKASLHASLRPADGGPGSFGTSGKHINADRDNVPSVCRRARGDDCPIIQHAILSRPGRATSTNGIGFR